MNKMQVYTANWKPGFTPVENSSDTFSSNYHI